MGQITKEVYEEKMAEQKKFFDDLTYEYGQPCGCADCNHA